MIDFLKENNACEEVVEWCQGKTWEEIHETCLRGDWMLWLFTKTNPDDLMALTLAKGHCANTVRHLMKDDRSKNAVDIAIKFGEGKATKKELDSAAAAAADDVAYAASSAASYAVASYAASSAASYAVASYAASSAASYASAVASASDARIESEQETADICRRYLPIELWNKIGVERCKV